MLSGGDGDNQSILAKPTATPEYILRRDRVGDMGLVATRQAMIYEQEYALGTKPMRRLAANDS